eukprot:COSAG04_NODE_7098_length_1192_cov_1.138152_1_plen_86_part_10
MSQRSKQRRQGRVSHREHAVDLLVLGPAVCEPYHHTVRVGLPNHCLGLTQQERLRTDRSDHTTRKRKQSREGRDKGSGRERMGAGL